MPIQLPNPTVKKIQKGAPATAATLNEPLIEVDENFEDVDTKIQDLNTKMDRVQDQLSINLDNEETEDLTVDKNLYVGEDLVVSKNVTIEGTLSASMDEAKSYLVPEMIYPSDWNRGSVWPTDYTQQADGQWTWNHEPSETTGRHYFYNPNGVWREPILNPAIGAHLGGDRIQFRSLKKLDHSAHDGRPIYEVSRLSNVRLVGEEDIIHNSSDGITLYTTSPTKYSLAIVGYCNDFKVLCSYLSLNFNFPLLISVNGVNSGNTISKDISSYSPISGRYLPANINLSNTSEALTLGVNTIVLDSDQSYAGTGESSFGYVSGIELIVNQTTLQIPAQKAVVQGKVVSLPASTPAYKPAAQSTDLGQTGVWDNATDIANGEVNFNGGRVVHYLKPGSDTLQTRVNWMPANAKYQEEFNWATGSQVNATNGQVHPTVIKEGSNYHCWWSKANAIWYVDTTTPETWGNGIEVLSANAEETYDTIGAVAPSVYLDGSTYRMVYIGDNGTNQRLIYAEAENTDITTWTGHSLIIDIGAAGEADSTHAQWPSLLKIGSVWYLFYAGWSDKGRIMLATSTSPVPNTEGDWTKHGVVMGLGVNGDLDDTYHYRPSVVYDNNIFKMLYTGDDGTGEHRILYATSKDGLTWAKSGLHFEKGTSGLFDDFRVNDPMWLSDGSTYHMWYVGDDSTNHTLGYTSSPIITGINQQTYGSYSNSIHNGYVLEYGNLTMSGQEEIARVFHWREFGNGDKNGATSHGFDTLASVDSSRAFILDDSLTGLVGNLPHADSVGSINLNTSGDFLILTFLGTGVGFTIIDIGSSTTMILDGVAIRDLPGNWINTPTFVTIASGLPYGIHTLKIDISGGNTDLIDFTIFQPKQPLLPGGSVIISDYMLFADPKQITSADNLKIDKGATRVDSTREIKYDGVSAWNMTGIAPLYIGGRGMYLNGAYKELSFPFFGTSVCLRYNGDVNVQDALFELSKDGGTTWYAVSDANLSEQFSDASRYANYTFDTDGTFSQDTGGIPNGNFVGIKNLPLGHYILRISDTDAARYLRCTAIDYHCPIGRSNHYSPWKSRNPFYDELIGGGGLDTDDLIVGPDLLTKDEVNMGKKREIEAYWYLLKNDAVASGDQLYNLVRGNIYLNTKTKNVSYSPKTGKITIHVSGEYDFGFHISASSAAHLRLYVNGNTIHTHMSSYANSVGVSPAVTGYLLHKGDEINTYRNAGGNEASADYNQFWGILRKVL